MTLLNRPDRAGLAANIAAFTAAVLGLNALIFLSGWFQTDAPGTAAGVLNPPGWLVGIVWVLQFALMGAARWLLIQSDKEQARRQAKGVIFLGLFCLAYPVYTLGLKSMVIGLIGNIATLAAAGWVVRRVQPSSPSAARCLLPTAVWVSYATVLTGLMLYQG